MKNRSRHVQHALAKPFLGYETEPRKFGLSKRDHGASGEIACHEGRAHLCTIGQSGCGKTNLLIANLLTWVGPAVVVDVRGDAAHCTARWRRDVLRQKVYILDPFALTDTCDRLDPLDVIQLPGTDPDAEAQSMAALFTDALKSDRDPFWHTTAGALLAGLMGHAMSQPDATKRSMQFVIDLLFTDNFDYKLATMLDAKLVPERTFAYTSISTYLQLPDTNGSTRSCVRAEAQAMLEPFRSRAVRRALGPSTVNLTEFLSSEPVTIYLLMPVERMASHSLVLGLWIDLLCQTLLRRTTIPRQPTLFFVDECAQISGIGSALKTIATYMRGQGVKLWTFFQDFAQIKSMFKDDFPTFVNNNSAITLMPSTGMAASQLAETLGVPLHVVQTLSVNEQAVYEVGAGTRVVRMAKYWADEPFKNRADPAPRYSLIAPQRADRTVR